MAWLEVDAVVARGHRVASGLNRDPRFPGGTLAMQAPFFRERGLDLGAFHPATLNVSVAPLRYRIVRAPLTFRDVNWHPSAPAEHFSFFDVRVISRGAPPVAGLVYYPHPETKPEHFQAPSVLELLLPWIDGVAYGTRVRLGFKTGQIAFEPA